MSGLHTIKSFKVFSRLYGFYLVILSLSIKLALMKYHIKPSGMNKMQGFCQDLYGYDLFFIVVETT